MSEERTSCPGRGNCLNCVNGIKIKNLQMWIFLKLFSKF
jgi:hypothetical protein